MNDFLLKKRQLDQTKAKTTLELLLEMSKGMNIPVQSQLPKLEICAVPSRRTSAQECTVSTPPTRIK